MTFILNNLKGTVLKIVLTKFTVPVGLKKGQASGVGGLTDYIASCGG